MISTWALTTSIMSIVSTFYSLSPRVPGQMMQISPCHKTFLVPVLSIPANCRALVMREKFQKLLLGMNFAVCTPAKFIALVRQIAKLHFSVLIRERGLNDGFFFCRGENFDRLGGNLWGFKFFCKRYFRHESNNI